MKLTFLDIEHGDIVHTSLGAILLPKGQEHETIEGRLVWVRITGTVIDGDGDWEATLTNPKPSEPILTYVGADNFCGFFSVDDLVDL